MSLKAGSRELLGPACCACAEQRSLPFLRRAAVTGRLASAGCLLTWQPAVGPAFCLVEANMHHQRVRQRTRIHSGNGKDTPAVQGLPTMVRPVPIIMRKLKQRKQKEGKATGLHKRRFGLKEMPSAHPPGTGSMCAGEVLLEHGNATSRRRPGRIRSRQTSPVRPAALALVLVL